MRYDAVVFDNDGVLTRPTDLSVVREAIRETFAELGVDPPEEHVRLILRATPERVRSVAAAHGLDPDRLWARRERAAAAAQRELLEAGEKPLYGDCDALAELRGRGVALGVVSNNQQATVEHVLEVHDLAGLFGAAYGREPSLAGIRRKKPDPHYLRRALADLDADRALYVGDSGSDVAAAHNAGVDAAFLSRADRADAAPEPAPTYEIGSLRALSDLV